MLIVLGVLWIVLSIAAASLATSKKQSGMGVFVVSMLFSPLVGGFLALLLPDNDKTERAAAAKAGAYGAYRKCPHCAEVIRREASLCAHCRSAVEPLPPDAPFLGPPLTPEERAAHKRTMKRAMVSTAIAAAGLLAFFGLVNLYLNWEAKRAGPDAAIAARAEAAIRPQLKYPANATMGTVIEVKTHDVKAPYSTICADLKDAIKPTRDHASSVWVYVERGKESWACGAADARCAPVFDQFEGATVCLQELAKTKR